jgi:quercetin dioxygenase-like cupin family protein
VLCDLTALSAAAGSAGSAGGAAAPAGALWRLTEPGRQLDANLVHLPPDARVEAHTEGDLDVLLAVVAGGGTLGGAPDPQPLGPGSLVWLPHGAARFLAAGAAGLSYLTVHRRRPGLRIGRRTDG